MHPVGKTALDQKMNNTFLMCTTSKVWGRSYNARWL